MPDPKHLHVILKSRPAGEPAVDNFALVEAPVKEPQEGEVLRRTIYLSLDPYMRGRMSAARSYAAPVEVGQLMVGGTVSQVIASRNPKFAEGDFVASYDGWQQYATSEGRGLWVLDPKQARISYA